MDNNEIWKPVVGYEGYYEVSNLGRVRSLDRIVDFRGSKQLRKGRVLKNRVTTQGYYSVVLYKNGIKKQYKVHRLVAEAFLENPDNLPCINHRDECKINNYVENLEWCTHKYNIEYSGNIKKATKASIEKQTWKIAQKKAAESVSKRVLQFTINGDLVKEYRSAMEAGRITGFNHSNISKACKGYYNTSGGYKWRFKDEKEK